MGPQLGKHMIMAEPREKLPQKSKDTTETPTRDILAAITPNTKKASKREQDPPTKSRSMRKKGLLIFLGRGHACQRQPRKAHQSRQC
jgi:hypothetical protein